MFEMRLAGVTPDFGYITSTKRRLFFEFCIANGFLNSEPYVTNGKASLYKVHITFRFEGILDYRSKPIIFVEDFNIIVQESFEMSNITIDAGGEAFTK